MRLIQTESYTPVPKTLPHLDMIQAKKVNFQIDSTQVDWSEKNFLAKWISSTVT